jgi:hypothetical protein
MTEFFREYFATQAQGGDAQNPGRFQQTPMTVVYDVGDFLDQREWLITPTNFPSFRRSNEQFAPEWRIEAQVVQADRNIQVEQKQDALARLQDSIGYKVKNPFSDPLADPASAISDVTQQIVSQFRAILPYITQGDLEQMIWQDISVPNIDAGKSLDPAEFAPGEALQGEVGFEAPEPVPAHDPPTTSASPIFVPIVSGGEAAAGGGGGGGSEIGNNAPGDPSTMGGYEAQIAAQAPSYPTDDEHINSLKKHYPPYASYGAGWPAIPPELGKCWFGGLMDEGRVFGVGHDQSGTLEKNCQTLAPHIHVKYRQGGTVTVFI